MYKAKGFIIGATLLALVLISSNIGLACGTKPAQTPTEQQPVSPVASLSPEVPQLPEEAEPPPPKPEITTNYTTYTDESNYFSISYPPDWETSLSHIGVLEEDVKKAIDNLKTGMSVTSPTIIFFAGRRTANGFEPSVNIVVERVFEDTLDLFVQSMIGAAKRSLLGYRELSRVKTTVDGKEATIVEWEGVFKEQGKRHYVQMFMLIDGTVWTVTCTAFPEDFAQWENDFNTILKSFKINTAE
jgi:hypothetical protein